MDPSEIEFLAEKESIEVVPNFTHGVMHLIQGDVGPFRPGLPVSVPLWLAVNLRQRQRCRLVRPDWLAVDRLEEVGGCNTFPYLLFQSLLIRINLSLGFIQYDMGLNFR